MQEIGRKEEGSFNWWNSGVKSHYARQSLQYVGLVSKHATLLSVYWLHFGHSSNAVPNSHRLTGRN